MQTTSELYPYTVKENRDGLIGNRVMPFITLDSTNETAKKNADNLPDGAVIISASQTKGRGRHGRVWESGGENIYMSVVLKPKNVFELTDRLFMYSSFAALAVKKLLKNHGIASGLKWPNDVIVNRRKICGILAETVICGQAATVVLGIGLNVNGISFSKELVNKAASMSIETSSRFCLAEITQELFYTLDCEYSNVLSGNGNQILKEYRESCISLGCEVVSTERAVSGIAVDIADDGTLLVETSGGIARLNSGEVTVKGIF